MKRRRAGGNWDFETQTDAGGRLVWHGAPPDAVRFMVFHQDYREVRDVALRPGPEERVVQGNAQEQFRHRKLEFVALSDQYHRPMFHDGAYEMRITGRW